MVQASTINELFTVTGIANFITGVFNASDLLTTRDMSICQVTLD